MKTADPEAREKMHNASAVAGMAIRQCILQEFVTLSPTRLVENTAFLMDVRMQFYCLISSVTMRRIRKNMRCSLNMTTSVQMQIMLTLLELLGLKGNTTAELVEALIEAVYNLGATCGIDMNLKAQGVTQETLNSTVDRMAELAYEDQCTTANPKEPLISELKEIIVTAYDYKA